MQIISTENILLIIQFLSIRFKTMNKEWNQNEMKRKNKTNY